MALTLVFITYYLNKVLDFWGLRHLFPRSNGGKGHASSGLLNAMGRPVEELLDKTILKNWPRLAINQGQHIVSLKTGA